jgi:hypothetical protein
MRKLNKSFSIIKEHILPNTLVVLDFDETIIQFNNFHNIFDFWRQTFDKFYNESFNFDEADNKTYSLWKDNILNNDEYSCTDYNNLINLINETNKSNNKIIIITARDKEMDLITRKQLQKLNVQINEIYYTNNKAETILNICKNNIVENIVFVDDLYTNINDVKDNCNKYNLFVYHADFIKNKYQ